MSRVCAYLLLLLLLASQVFGATNYVSPGESIQTAISTANNGDSILLEIGTHILSSELSVTKGITLGSVGSYSNTIIDGNNSTRCIYVNHSNAIIDDLTITHGMSTNLSGAGVYCSDGTIQNCFISDNHLISPGDGYSGGGVCAESSGIVSNCIIRNNTANYGAGAYCRDSAIVQNCTIEGNVANDYGGGVYCRSIVRDCTIASNSASGGGGIYLSSGQALRSTIFSNTASSFGGGIYARSLVRNCVVYGNHANSSGGGICLYTSSAALSHCTIVDNTAGSEGGGVYPYLSSMPNAISNSIIYFNNAPVNPDTFQWSGYNFCCSSSLNPGDGNVSSDPVFVNRTNQNYQLLAYSPCVDASSYDEAILYDVNLQGRAVDGDNNGSAVPDMGAYEYQGNPGHPTHSLIVQGLPGNYGSPWPLDFGSYNIVTGKNIVASIPSVEDSDGSRLLCLGWTGTGSVPSSGITNFVSFTLDSPSALTWNIQLQHALETGSSLGVISGAITGYWDDATQLVLSFTPTAGYLLHHWEVNDIYAGTNNPLSICMTEPKNVQAVCEANGQVLQTLTFDGSPWTEKPPSADVWEDSGLSFEEDGLTWDSSGSWAHNGTPFLIFGNRYGPTSWIRLKAAGTFSLVSIDISEYSPVYMESSMDLVGHRADGSTVSQRLNLDGIIDGPGGSADFQTFSSFSSFTNLIAISSDIGGYSLDNLTFRLDSLDKDNDGMDDEWELLYFGTLARDGSENADNDSQTDWQEWLTGSNPTNANDVFLLTDTDQTSNGSAIIIRWQSLSNRIYSVDSRTNFISDWENVYKYTGNGSLMSYTGVMQNAQTFYCVFVEE